MSSMKRTGMAAGVRRAPPGAARVCWPAAGVSSAPRPLSEKGPRIKFKCGCPRPVCPPCDSPWFGYYPTCWSPWRRVAERPSQTPVGAERQHVGADRAADVPRRDDPQHNHRRPRDDESAPLPQWRGPERPPSRESIGGPEVCRAATVAGGWSASEAVRIPHRRPGRPAAAQRAHGTFRRLPSG
jgi:hypothetical protein